MFAAWFAFVTFAATWVALLLAAPPLKEWGAAVGFGGEAGPGLVAIVAGLVVWGFLQRRRHVPEAVVPRPVKWLIGLVGAAGSVPAALGIVVIPWNVVSYYLLFPWVLCVLLAGPLWITGMASVRWPWAPASERRLWCASTAFSLLAVALWASKVGLHLVFLLHYPLFEMARAAAPEAGWCHGCWVGAFWFDELGYTPDRSGQSTYFAGDWCEPRIPEAQDDGAMCFAHTTGEGIYWAPPGAPDPILNQSLDEPLYGGWRWYLDD